MKDTLAYILQQIVDSPEAVHIDEKNEESRTILRISVAEEDMGKIIGKHGRIIRSIRDIIKLMAAKSNSYVDVILAE